MNEQKMNLIFTNSFIFFVILFSNFSLFLLMKFFGFQYERFTSVCFFIFTFFTLSTTLAIIIENGVHSVSGYWNRQLYRLVLIPLVNFLIIIGLLIGLPDLVIPASTIISMSMVSFIAESIFMYWINSDYR